jgi:hypothetical protein
MKKFIDVLKRNIKIYNVLFNQSYGTESLRSDNHSADLQITHLSWNPMFITMFTEHTTGLYTEADESSNPI